MTTSSSRRGAATRAPPPPDQLAAFYKLVDKKVIAGQLSRYARHVELSAQAAVQAEALFGDDSLVVASMRMAESEALNNLNLEAPGEEKVALFRRSWAVLVSLISLLLRRLEANTLLPGTMREEELDFEVHVQATISKAKNEPVPPPAVLREWASTIGYETLLSAMFRSLHLLMLRGWPAAQTTTMESFVLRGLDIIPRTAGIPAESITSEKHLVSIIEEDMNPHDYGATFYASVLRKWRSEALRSVLQTRGVLQTGIAKAEQSSAEFKARQRDDIAKHGLRNCALPSCSKTEKTVKEFAACSGCRSVVYCCLEHQALDWRPHKKACREKEQQHAEEAEARGGRGT